MLLWIYLKGLKTGMYYLRSRAAADAIKFTVDTAMLKVEKTMQTLYADSSCELRHFTYELFSLGWM